MGGCPGGNLWEEKLDYTRTWLTAHLQDATSLGKPLLVEEFGKAVDYDGMQSKIYTTALPHPLTKGTHSIVSADAVLCSV